MDKKYTTIYCLTAITIVGLLVGYHDIFGIWVCYGIYRGIRWTFKEDKKEDE